MEKLIRRNFLNRGLYQDAIKEWPGSLYKNTALHKKTPSKSIHSQ